MSGTSRWACSSLSASSPSSCSVWPRTSTDEASPWTRRAMSRTKTLALPSSWGPGYLGSITTRIGTIPSCRTALLVSRASRRRVIWKPCIGTLLRRCRRGTWLVHAGQPKMSFIVCRHGYRVASLTSYGGRGACVTLVDKPPGLLELPALLHLLRLSCNSLLGTHIVPQQVLSLAQELAFLAAVPVLFDISLVSFLLFILSTCSTSNNAAASRTHSSQSLWTTRHPFLPLPSRSAFLTVAGRPISMGTYLVALFM